MNKGAMFGLDARIALAIFGALSVISGAALYSAIQQAKVQQYISTLTEIAKALEAYYLDVGDLPKVDPGDSDHLNIVQLAENEDGVSNWNGPYIDFKVMARIGDALRPKLGYQSGCGQDAEGLSGVFLRKLSYSGDATLRNIRVHMNCIPDAITEEMSLKLLGKSQSATSWEDSIYFLDAGTGYKQVYYTVLVVKN